MLQLIENNRNAEKYNGILKNIFLLFSYQYQSVSSGIKIMLSSFIFVVMTFAFQQMLASIIINN